MFLFQLTSRVESLENILGDIQDYVRKATQNSTELPLITDRKIPGDRKPFFGFVYRFLTVSVLFVFLKEEDICEAY